MGQKLKYSQDDLYQYLLAHNITIKRLGELIGQSDVAMSNAFKHNVVNGKPHYFSDAIIRRINEALPMLASEIASRVVTFNAENNTSRRAAQKFDPGCIQQFQRAGEYFNLTTLLVRVLGWKKRKKNDVICTPSSKVYGHITEDDVRLLNAELLTVAGELENMEIVHSDAAGGPVIDNEGTHTKGIPPSGRSLGGNPWDDTSLDLLDRYAAFHRLFPDGLIAFAVNDGFTVCEDDARLLARIDTTLLPYTEPFTGHVTLYMNAAKWQQMRRAWDDGDEMVAETPMYAE